MRQRPQLTDPRLRALVSAGRRRAPGRGVSRRDFLAGVLGTAGAAAALAACGGGPAPAGPTGSSPGAGGHAVRWASWPLYLDQDDEGTAYPSLEAFTAGTGIDVQYTEAVEDNDEFTAAVADALTAGEDCGYDLVTLTDWMAARWVQRGWAQRFDRSRIPNADNIVGSLASVDFDLSRTRTLTWQSGFTGIAWDTQALPGGLRSVSDLWSPELSGRVDVLSEMYDTMGLLLIEAGVELAGEWSDTQFVAALDLLREKVESGHVHRVVGNSYVDDLVSGDAVACVAWSGDITALNYEHEGRFAFAIPEAGGVMWSDNLMIPVGSPNAAAAEELINYYYDPAVAAQVAAWVNYVTPVEGAREAMAEIDPELAQDTLIFPDEAILASVQVFPTLDPADDERYAGRFADAVGA